MPAFAHRVGGFIGLVATVSPSDTILSRACLEARQVSAVRTLRPRYRGNQKMRRGCWPSDRRRKLVIGYCPARAFPLQRIHEMAALWYVVRPLCQ